MNMCVVYYIEDTCLVCVWYVYNYIYNTSTYTNMCRKMYTVCMYLLNMNTCMINYVVDTCLVCV